MKRPLLTITMIHALLISVLAAGAAEPKKVEEVKAQANCEIKCDEPMSAGDSQAIIDVLKLITKALAERDYTRMESFLDANCTTYDSAIHKLVVGRDSVISNVKQNVANEERRLKNAPISYTIDHPYVRITGEQAVVTFVLIKEISGHKPTRYESHCSDVFIKRNDVWKKLHFCGGNWKKVN